MPGFVSFLVGLFYELEMGIFFGKIKHWMTKRAKVPTIYFTNTPETCDIFKAQLANILRRIMSWLQGMGVHIIIVLYSTARPKVEVEIRQVTKTIACPTTESPLKVAGEEYLRVAPDQGIVFPSVSFIRNLVNKAGSKHGNSGMPVVIDCEHISKADFTAASSFKAMMEDFEARGQPVYWLNPGERLASTLKVAAGPAFRPITSPAQISW